MNLTDLTAVDKKTRQWRKTITMREQLQRRMDYYNKNDASDISAGHKERFRSVQALLTSQITRLDSNQLISHPLLGVLITKRVGEVMDYVFTHLPKPRAAQKTEIELAAIELMHNKGREARAQQHRFNLNAEIAYRTTAHWFMVFNTLTVEQGKYKTVFNRDSKEFKNYIRAFTRNINEAETGTRNGNAEINHNYFACVEEGGQNGRLHIHVLHFFRTLPDRWQDPNRGRPRPELREIAALKSLWKHGYSVPIAVRYSPKDAYGLSGWRWPYDKRKENSLQIGSPLKLGSYMSKYIIKGYASCKRAELLWRVRKSHNLGTPILAELVSQLTPAALVLIATDPTINLRLNNNKIPNPLLRRAALRQYQNLQSTETHSNIRSLREIAENVTPRPSLLHSLKGSMTTTHANNPQNTITSLINECSQEGISNLWAEIYIARKTIDDRYYRRSNSGYGTTSTADYIAAADQSFTQAHRTQNQNGSRSKGTLAPQQATLRRSTRRRTINTL